MKIIKQIILAAILSASLLTDAQDIHFSQFAMSPLLLNPALAGFSTGDYRAYANFRTQWNTVADGNAYRTFAGGADMVVGKATRYSSFAGVGISFFSDQAGAAGFQTNNVALTFAYHFVMNRRRNMTLSIGLQGGFNNMGFNPAKATFDYNYDPSTGVVNTNQRESFSRSQIYFGDVGAGAFYTATLRSGTELYIGAGLSHINQPDISFFSGATTSSIYNERLDMKFTSHGGVTAPVGKKLWLIPNYFVMVQGPARQYNAGAMLKMQIGNKVLSKNFFYLGAQVRVAQAMVVPMADAVIFHSRFDCRGFTLGLSYDVNVSKLASSSATFGAPELSVMYTIAAKHKPNPGYCPVMM